jgi:hypothetical protein
LSDQVRRTLVKRLHRGSLVTLSPDTRQITTGRLKDIARFVVNREQRGSAEHTYINGQSLVAKFQYLLSQESVVFAFSIEGADDTDGTH